jgi:peptide/nickel transport system permease protein
VLSLREKEFIEAARMVGGSNFRIMRSHLLPHLVGTIIVYGTVTIAINILLESTLSFLGVGLPEPNASWGKLLDQAVQFYTIQPWLIVWPGLMLLIVTLSFNLLGDGLRDALDPRASL